MTYFVTFSLEGMDLFAAAMSETPLEFEGSSLGPTFTCLITQQMKELKDGDRFYYKHPESGFNAGK